MPFARTGKRVDFSPAPTGFGPGAPNEAFLLQPMKDGVERAMAEPEQSVAVGLDIQPDLVSMFRACPQCGKNKQFVDVPGEGLNVEVSLGHDLVLPRRGGYNLSAVVISTVLI